MSAFPQWDARVIWPSGEDFAVDLKDGLEAFYGPLGEPAVGTPAAAGEVWGDGNFVGWSQPDGRGAWFPPAGGMTEALLAGILAPLGLVNDEALALWARSEGMPASAFNPCATLRTGYGEHYQDPYRAPFYPNIYAGQRAWLDTINEAGHGYEAIMSAFQRQAGLVDIYDAINLSDWCKGCSDGHYPVALWSQAGQPSSGAGGSSTQTPPAPASSAPTDPDEAANVHASYQALADLVTRDIPGQSSVLRDYANTNLTG